MQPSKALQGVYRKLQLTTKDIKKGFYKGTGSGSMGSHTKWGTYKIDWRKVRTYVVPKNLAETKLTPFVTKKMEPINGFGQYRDRAGPKSPQLYLDRWKAENGLD
ncbi:hypothetical protein GGTG_00204 [Gaeumannomyces tritici R3-111a-1]|uniref:50S ribosomal protein YmL27 n=1 Tax=Gaeumannomyces tritici (strain R3-111a-1) TaxID=644352 RepID=J3NG11_GAET3|nr:hypothetical protein GGTG_00204 [Gaeumannomyces tritici R3-111a-1]EJT80201.1 hypothetical protein GGTG_00204 [Gaeumannomyces tritici R3-111a-1]